MIVHHTAIAYGGHGGWLFRSRCFPAFSVLLTAFNAINQTFFMGTFFFLSGYFTRQSISHRSRSMKEFVCSRMLRLGLPAILYTLLIEPTLEGLVQLLGTPTKSGFETSVFGNIYWSYWSQLRGIRGPVWYLAVVMVFDILSVVIFPGKFGNFLTRLSGARMNALVIPTLWAGNILASFAIRLIYPVDRVFGPLNLRPAFLPQYILAYTWGHASALHDDLFLFAPFPLMVGPLADLVWSLCFSFSGLGVLFGISVWSSTSERAAIEHVVGGFSVPALLYAIWNEASFALIGPSLMRAFANYANHPVRLNSWGCLGHGYFKVHVARYSYAAFLCHALVSLGVELVVEAFSACSNETKENGELLYVVAGPALMTMIVGVTNVLLSWVFGWALVQYVPGVGKVV
jgi:glucans biosynthesis protein C